MSAKYAFAKGLKEVRFHMCHTNNGSDALRYGCPNHFLETTFLAHRSVHLVADPATRTFLKRAYPAMKKANPQTPILIREALGTEPKVWTRFGYGKERSESLTGEKRGTFGKEAWLNSCRSFRSGHRDESVEYGVKRLMISTIIRLLRCFIYDTRPQLYIGHQTKCDDG